jgi:hypothetical protein
MAADTRRERAPLVISAVLVFATFFAYPLSAGPVGWAIIQCGRPGWTEPYFESAYAPAFWLQGRGPIGRLLNSYYKWWWD